MILGVLFVSFLFLFFPLAIFCCVPRLFTNHDMRLFSFRFICIGHFGLERILLIFITSV